MASLQTEPITTMAKSYNTVLDKLEQGPVLLLQRSSLAAVLLSPAQWNSMSEELERLRRVVQADKDFADMRQGKYTEG